jgi:hypothetical protein
MAVQLVQLTQWRDRAGFSPNFQVLREPLHCIARPAAGKELWHTVAPRQDRALTGLRSLHGWHVLAFVLGFAASVLTVLVVRVQHGNYRAARDHMRRIEEDLSLEQSQRLDTTSTLGGRRRVASVNHVVYLLLGALAAANLYGFLARLIASN